MLIVLPRRLSRLQRTLSHLDAVGYDGGVAGFSTGTDASWQVNVDPAGLGLRGSYGCDPKHGWYEGLAFDGGVLEGGYSTNRRACVT